MVSDEAFLLFHYGASLLSRNMWQKSNKVQFCCTDCTLGYILVSAGLLKLMVSYTVDWPLRRLGGWGEGCRVE
jgi:hypothetical protein